MRHCKYHCAICDAHFTSLAGFDAHIMHPSCGLAPKNSKRIKYTQVEGVCDLTKGLIGQSVPCLIWADSTEKEPFIKSRRTLSKASGGGSGVIPPTSPQDRPQHTPIYSERTPVGTDHHAEYRYWSGHYRQPCRICGKGIKRTGRRGRAPIKHPNGECVK